MSRVIDYIRISVIDRCNMRCVYCNPMGTTGFLKHEDILRYEELERLLRLFSASGIRKVRITGGEPLVRRGLPSLISRIASIEGIDDISLTTNGVLLARLAGELARAGLRRINISLDSARREIFRKITGFDHLDLVLSGLEEAIAAGLYPVKLNAIIFRGINEEDILLLADLAHRLDIEVRFIEYNPTSDAFEGFSRNSLSSPEIIQVLQRRFGRLIPIQDRIGSGPSESFSLSGSSGMVGFISGNTKPFCSMCNRLRLSSDGKVYLCLFSRDSYDLREMLRTGKSDSEIIRCMRKIMEDKKRYTRKDEPLCGVSMRCIGG